MAEFIARGARTSLYRIAALSLFLILAMSASMPLAAQDEPYRWNGRAAYALLDYIDQMGNHGLDPADYAPTTLARAIASRDPQRLEEAASQSFGLVARDLAEGHVRPASRRSFHLATIPLEPEAVAQLIDRALASGDIVGTLESLAPTNPQYTLLRKELASLPATEDEMDKRTALRVNLERWRWLPRDFGARYLMVNVPEFLLRLMENGEVRETHRVIVGKTSTPTPQFSATVTAVTLNPAWHVPQSIIAESVGKLVRTRPGTARARGYTWSYSSGTLHVTQQPGPNNALGQIKLEMPNPLSIYVHDTPSKQLFEREQRTFSHGCIRMDKPFDLGTTLLADMGWDRERIDAVVETRKTTRVTLDRPLPIYVLYLTAMADEDGTVHYFGDPYKRDPAIIDALGPEPATPLAAAQPFQSECAAA